MEKRNLIVVIFIAFLSALVNSNSAARSEERSPIASDIVIGIATSLTSLEGAECLMAATLAVEEINGAGGAVVGGIKRPLRIETVDLKDSEPNVKIEDSLKKFDDFLRHRTIHAVIVGPFRSEVFLPAMDILAAHRIPMIGTIAMSSAVEAKVLKNPEYKYVFRTGLNTKYLADYLIESMRFLKNRFGFRRVYIMSQDVAWARSTASLMIRWYFDKAGWEILGTRHYPSDTRDFSEGLIEAAEKEAEVILPIFDAPSSGGLVTQWKKLKIQAILCGFISPMTGPDAWRRFDGRIGGAINVAFELGNIPAKKYPPATAFYESFKNRFGKEIQAGHGPAPAYESVYVLVSAVQTADSVEADKIVKALEATDRTGALGRMRFHKGHQIIFGDDPKEDALACLFQWSEFGRRVIVYPPSIAEDSIHLNFSP